MNTGTTAGDGDFPPVLDPVMTLPLSEAAEPLLCLVWRAKGERLGEAGTAWFCAAVLRSPNTMLTVRGEGWKEEKGELEWAAASMMLLPPDPGFEFPAKVPAEIMLTWHIPFH